MTRLQLFLGILVDSKAVARLKSSKDYLRFFSPDSDYLAEVEGGDGCRYIGKILDQLIDGESLHNTEANIYSLLDKLDPHFSYKSVPLVLFPYVNS